MLYNETGITTLNKATPVIRIDELTDDSSRYEHFSAAPPDEELVKYWYSWVALAFINGFFSLLVFLSIVANRRARRKPFNLYLIYLMIPDFTFSLLCALTCLMNAIHGSYWSHWMCNFQQFYVVFGIGANAWLNLIIAHQLHIILRFSKCRRRYKLPTRRVVTIHAIASYSWCLFLASWGTFESKKFPFHSGQASGLACLPLDGEDLTSSLFFWLCFFPLFAGIPVGGVTWICWDIYYRNLMPPPGRRRIFTIYFARLIIVFLIMWIPTLLLLFVLARVPHALSFIGGTWSHMQGGLSAYLILLKPDIWKAFRKFMPCSKDDPDDDLSDRGSRMFSSELRISSNWMSRRPSKSGSMHPESISNSFGLADCETAKDEERSGELTEEIIVFSEDALTTKDGKPTLDLCHPYLDDSDTEADVIVDGKKHCGMVEILEMDD